MSARIYYYAHSERRSRKLSFTHWGFAEWFERRLKPIREQLRGPEVKGVNIVSLMLRENPAHAPQPDQWLRRLKLSQPLSEEDQRTLRPFLQWPRSVGYVGRLVGGASAD